MVLFGINFYFACKIMLAVLVVLKRAVIDFSMVIGYLALCFPLENIAFILLTEVDCGTPPQRAGSNYDLQFINTIFGNSFLFTCTTGSVSGTSEIGDQTVRCQADGYWDFGSLQCFGEFIQLNLLFSNMSFHQVVTATALVALTGTSLILNRTEKCKVVNKFSIDLSLYSYWHLIFLGAKPFP